MNSTVSYKLLLLFVLTSFRYDLVRCADSQGSTPTTPSTPSGGTSGSSGKKSTSIELNIDEHKQNTDQYDYEFDKKTKIAKYTCKDGNGFGSVKYGKAEMWKAKDNKYATKVTVRGVGTGSISVTCDEVKTA